MSRHSGSPVVGYQVVNSNVVGRNRIKNMSEAHTHRHLLYDKVRLMEASRRPVKWYVKLWRKITEWGVN